MGEGVWRQSLPGSGGIASRVDTVASEAPCGGGIGLLKALGEVLQGSGVPGLEDPAPDLFAFLGPVRHVEAPHQDVEGVQIPIPGHIG